MPKNHEWNIQKVCKSHQATDQQTPVCLHSNKEKGQVATKIDRENQLNLLVILKLFSFPERWGMLVEKLVKATCTVIPLDGQQGP